MGIGMPISHSNAPFPKPIPSSISVAMVTAGEKESSCASRVAGHGAGPSAATLEQAFPVERPSPPSQNRQRPS